MGGPTAERTTVRTSRPRRLARASAVALAAFALLACVALVVLATASRARMDRTMAIDDALRSLGMARINLGNFGRAADLAYITKDPGDELGRVHAEADLLTSLGSASARVTDPPQRELLARAEVEIRDYLLLRAKLESENAPAREAFLASAPVFQRAFDTLHQAATVGFEEESSAEHILARWALIASVLGLSVAVLVAAGFVSVGAILRRSIVVPLLALGEGIERVAGGDQTARVVPTGLAEVRHASSSFNDMAERLSRQQRDLLTFLAGVAHDLRNPLAAMRMGAHLLSSEGPSVAKETRTRALAIFDRQVTRLERMVGDFLDATRIEAGQLDLQLEERDLRGVVLEGVQLYAASSSRHRIRLSEPETPVEVRCDAERIAQVFDNLISNAVKYSPSGGDIRVCLARRGDEAILSVQDPGIGIPPEDLEHIFEPFRRTGVSKETAPGVGLGLSVAKHIVEAHGGRIEVESTVGVGSTFRVHLPLATAAARLEAPALH